MQDKSKTPVCLDACLKIFSLYPNKLKTGCSVVVKEDWGGGGVLLYLLYLKYNEDKHIKTRFTLLKHKHRVINKAIEGSIIINIYH